MAQKHIQTAPSEFSWLHTSAASSEAIVGGGRVGRAGKEGGSWAGSPQGLGPCCLQKHFQLNCQVWMFCHKGQKHKWRPSFLRLSFAPASAKLPVLNGNSSIFSKAAQPSTFKVILPSGAGKPQWWKITSGSKNSGGNKFELNLLYPENVSQGTCLMKLQLPLETVLMLHFKV